ncbi:MAG: GHKL domain-containing protein [Bdellovibrionaceae bacterium]|nr:GHKL domain-containing protein [Bdellovibrionales bacterium]MCB9086087.1 GHKL domain-containing protein [Pseudobdellovibrionaceae bacterium]
MKKKPHRMLERQLRKAHLQADQLPKEMDQWLSLLERISQTYLQAEQDRYLLERSLKISSEEIRQSQEQMAHNAKLASLGEMAGGIAHEINNPLTIIAIQVEKLEFLMGKKGIADSDLDAGLTSIRTTCDRIARIVKGLRQFASGSENRDLAPVDLSEVIGLSIEMCEQKLRNRGVGCRFMRERQTVIVDANSIQLSQVILNLISNGADAVKNLDEKWIRVELKETGQYGQIYVTDSGAGIPEAIRSKIMQPFFTTKEIGEGTGLGLSVSKGLIEGFGGKLEYNSNCPNTQFIISLRKHVEVQEDLDEAA